MKRIILTLIVSLLTLSLIPLPSSKAEDIEITGDGYVYTIINNQATITGFTGEPAVIEIPETIEYCPVTEIRDNAFYECTSLKQISLPKGLKKIGHHCFYGCSSLESIIIPDTVTEADIGCFCGCITMTNAVVSSGMTELPESFFRACTSLTDIRLPDGITNIGDFCFSGCTSLKDVILPSDVMEIGDCAFFMCGNMESIYIPPSAVSIGICAFGYIPDDKGAVPAENFRIIGEKNSAADEYARVNQFSFINAADQIQAMAIREYGKYPSPMLRIYLITGGILFAVIFIVRLKRSRRNKH